MYGDPQVHTSAHLILYCRKKKFRGPFSAPQLGNNTVTSTAGKAKARVLQFPILQSTTLSRLHPPIQKSWNVKKYVHL